MPIKEKDVQSFLEELFKEVNYSDEEKKSLESLIEKGETKFKSGVHAERLLQQKLSGLKTKETELESSYTSKMSEVESLRTQVANSDGQTKKENESLRRRLEKAQNEALKVHQELSKYDDGVDFLKSVDWDDPSKIRFNEGLVESKSNTEDKSKLNSSQLDYESKLKELQIKFNQDMGYMADFVTFLPMAQLEYKALHGKDLDINDFKSKIQEAAKAKSNSTFQEVFDSAYEMPQKREEKRQLDFETLVSKRVEEEIAKKTSDSGIPTDNRVNFESDFYKAVDSTRPKDDPSSTVRNDLIRRNETVNEAMLDFRQRIAGKELGG